MVRTAQVDVAAEEAPIPGEKFVISSQENSELLGLLSNDRTFRFASPTTEERGYATQGRTLVVLGFDGSPAEGKEHRLLGALTYREQVADDAAGHDAAEKLSVRSSDLYATVLDQSKKSVDALTAHVEKRPLASLLIAFAAGFVFSKVLSR